jgi:Protein of unknown function (DUF4019)
MIRKIAFLVVMMLLIVATPLMADEYEKKEAAIASADKWLKMVDEGKFIESWKESSVYFRQAIKAEQWQQTLAAVRTPLGNLISRKVKRATYTTSLPGAPDGEYVVLVYIASFANKKSGIETVTPQMDKDGLWRVSGYYIK